MTDSNTERGEETSAEIDSEEGSHSTSEGVRADSSGEAPPDETSSPHSSTGESEAENSESIHGGATLGEGLKVEGPADDESCEDDIGTGDVGAQGLTERAILEGLLFAHGEELSLARLVEISKIGRERVEEILREIHESYQRPEHGVELVQVAGKFQFRTKGDLAVVIRELKAARPRRLSAAALETLAIVAYRQPIVKSDIEQIRGVDVTPTLKTLLERSLVRIVGHQPSVGTPALYGTTEEFLALFGLNSLGELPTLRDLKDLEGDPGENEEASGESVADNEGRDEETPLSSVQPEVSQ